MAEVNERRKLWYDKKAVKPKLNVGDEVLVLGIIKKNKLSVPCIRARKIQSKISETNYIVNGWRETFQV